MRLKLLSKDLQNEDYLICEIGGTVGDIESLPFLEAIRQLETIEKKLHLFYPFDIGSLFVCSK